MPAGGIAAEKTSRGNKNEGQEVNTPTCAYRIRVYKKTALGEGSQ
jgi:hypothetical protein